MKWMITYSLLVLCSFSAFSQYEKSELSCQFTLHNANTQLNYGSDKGFILKIPNTNHLFMGTNEYANAAAWYDSDKDKFVFVIQRGGVGNNVTWVSSDSGNQKITAVGPIRINDQSFDRQTLECVVLRDTK